MENLRINDKTIITTINSKIHIKQNHSTFETRLMKEKNRRKSYGDADEDVVEDIKDDG